MAVSKEELLAKRFGVEEIEIPELGLFKLRPLTRAEALAIKDVEMPVALFEQRAISLACVEPALSEEDVASLQETLPAGLFEPLTDKIAAMSGMKKDATKSGVPGAGAGA